MAKKRYFPNKTPVDGPGTGGPGAGPKPNVNRWTPAGKGKKERLADAESRRNISRSGQAGVGPSYSPTTPKASAAKRKKRRRTGDAYIG